jgi:hypothetical protein
MFLCRLDFLLRLLFSFIDISTKMFVKTANHRYTENSRYDIKYTEIAGYDLACFALLVLLVATVIIHFNEQALEVATRSGRQTRQSALPALLWACLLCFVPAIFTCSSKWILY